MNAWNVTIYQDFIWIQIFVHSAYPRLIWIHLLKLALSVINFVINVLLKLFVNNAIIQVMLLINYPIILVFNVIQTMMIFPLLYLLVDKDKLFVNILHIIRKLINVNFLRWHKYLLKDLQLWLQSLLYLYSINKSLFFWIF